MSAAAFIPTRDFPRAVIEIAGTEYAELTEFAYESDILALGDRFSVMVPNPDGVYSGKIKPGDLVRFAIEDPGVAGGARTPKVLGRVISVDTASNEHGSTIRVTGADLGWHLANTCGPLWMPLQGIKFPELLARVLDPSWGFQGVAFGNLRNRKLKQNRSQIVGQQDKSEHAIIPRIQFEAGEDIASVLVRYATRENTLVNVSVDGLLQFFQPFYGSTSYVFHYEPEGGPGNAQNNVTDARLSETIDGLYTDVVCVGTIVRLPRGVTVDITNPNAQHFRGEFKATGFDAPVTFNRLLTFSDDAPLHSDEAKARALWKWQRGIFDSWTLTYETVGLSQGGIFFEPDSMAEVYDDVTQVHGAYYVSAIQSTCSLKAGTKTRLTLKKPNLLRGAIT